MTWKEFIHGLVVAHCNKNGSRTFSLKEFYTGNESEITRFKPENKRRSEKVRQQLQFLRDDGFITFLDNRGHYTLRGVEILKDEVDDDKVATVSNEAPDKREYLIETYARNRGWVRSAKDAFGDYCMCDKCPNTFLKENGEPYIEVHHIIPLFKGGEDGVWNLALLCAHHHKMAHFAELKVRGNMEKMLLSEVECRLKMIGLKP